MKQYIITLLILFVAFGGFAQEAALLMRQSTTGEQVAFEETRRITIKTVDGKKHTGKFRVVDNHHIQIKDHVIPLDSIVLIRSNSMFRAIASTAFFLYLGAISVGVFASFAIATYSTSAYFALVPLPVAVFYAFKSPNFSNGHKTKKHWQYSIVNYSKPNP